VSLPVVTEVSTLPPPVSTFAVSPFRGLPFAPLALQPMAEVLFRSMPYRDPLPLVNVGLTIGLATPSGLTRLLAASLYYDVTPSDPVTYLLVPGFMLFVASVACLIPAWNSARIDPIVALRYE
jgi:hypothetical protein